MGETPNKYLEQHLEPSRGEDHDKQSEAYERLNNPLAVVEYKDAGTIEIKTPDLEVTYTYEPKSEYDEFRKVLRSFTLINPHTDSKLSLIDILPSDYRIIFIPRAEEIGETMSFQSGSIRECRVAEDLATPAGILTLLHETGHAILEEQLSQDDKLKLWQLLKDFRSREKPPTIDQEQLETIFKNELEAWDFALNTIELFLNNSNLKKEDVLRYIHGEESLGAYSVCVRKRLGWD